MDKLKRDQFSGNHKKFNVKDVLNSILKPDISTEDEIISFKLKLIQREFVTEIDSNLNKFLNYTKNLDEELKNFNQVNNNYITRVNDITKQTNNSQKK